MTVNPALILIKVITAVYYMQYTGNDNSNMVEELRDYVNAVKIERTNSGIGTIEDILEQLKYTADWLLGSDNIVVDRTVLMQRLKMNVYGEHFYLTSISESLEENPSAENSAKRASAIVSELRHMTHQERIREAVKKANRDLSYGEVSDPRKYLKSLIVELETFVAGGDNEVIDGFNGAVDLSDENAIATLLSKTVELFSPRGILKTGLSGIDQATGIGGFRRGETINFGGITHNYKSGILNDCFLGIPAFTDPYMFDESLKPMILKISFENTLEQDIANLYRKLHEMRHQERIAISEIDIKQATKCLIEHFGQRGYHLKMEHYDPNNVGPYDLFDILNKYINNGYEIHAVIIDYLPLVSHNVVGDREDSRIQKIYEMVRNFTYARGITHITAAQLSTQAQDWARDNPPATLAKKFSTGGWYMGCKSLHTKLDLEFIIHKVEHTDGNVYLSVHRGKHRNGEHTPIAHHGFFYKFQEFGGIAFDYDHPEWLLRKLPAININSFNSADMLMMA